MNLRDAARNRPCMIRVPGHCDGGGETTVLAHYRLSGVSGMGFKAPDLLGSWSCAPCHAYVDGQHTDTAKAMHLEGMVRTINQLIKEGAVKW